MYDWNFSVNGDEGLEALAANLRCSDCHSKPPEVERDDDGTIIDILLIHEDSCPVLNGVIDPLGDIRRAAGGDAEYG